jgi:copper chaperone
MPLRFSKYGIFNIEKAYATHFVGVLCSGKNELPVKIDGQRETLTPKSKGDVDTMTCKSGGDWKTLAVVVSGMTCNHCKKAVEDAVSGVDGISSASVDLNKGLLKVVYDPEQVDFTKVQDAVVRAGYGASQN